MQTSVAVFLVAVLVLVLTVAPSLIKLDKAPRTPRPDNGQRTHVRYGLIDKPAARAPTQYEQQSSLTFEKRPR